MNQNLIPGNLSDLVRQSNNNPYMQWPNTTNEKIYRFLYRSAYEEDNTVKSFFFEKAERVYLYFQIHELSWDSKHFGFKCFAIIHFYIDEDISYDDIDEIRKEILPDLEEYLINEKVTFISADIASESKNGNYFIQSIGFKYILNWIDGIRSPLKIELEDTDLTISNIFPDEVNTFSKIASSSYYKGGRFYSDKRFDISKVDKLYEELIKNSFISGDIILACRDGNNPVGVFVCKKIKTYKEFNNLRVAPLRFLLVNPAYRNKSYGYKIFGEILKYLKNQCDLITTGLESNNIISMNLHSKMGFKFNYSHNSFHYWNMRIRK